MRNPLVSVIMPCYNQGEWIDAAIKSVKASTYKNLEIVVIDDGSTDEKTRQIFEAFDEPGVKLVRQSNQGVCAARNNGIKASSGELIMPLDCDDTISSTYIEKAVRVFERDASVNLVGGMYVFNTDGVLSEPWADLKRSGFVSSYFMAWNFLPPCCVMRRSAVEKLGGYSRFLSKWAFEDQDLFMRMFRKMGGLYMLNEIVWYYRQHGMSRNKHFFRCKIAKILILFRHWKFFVKSPKYIFAMLMWRKFGWLLRNKDLLKNEA